ncbi:class D sortase [Diplocloster modestus]|uniref:Class D sortase n=1 Tax=Diplocloster modestus TaxID=2850322 RepID=A0ABS6K3W7_9FIRM|nr:class D sortase [Diplocloster modestus]MBU9725219.1 class D sortase [Diplocloster modestus]
MAIAKKWKRLMAYIYMPLIFTVIGCVLVITALSPVIDLTYQVANMVVASEVPNFSRELNSIYVEPTAAQSDENIIPFDSLQLPGVGQQYGEISCERIGLNGPLYYGDTNQILKAGVGQYTGSFFPGFGRPLLLAAHNTTYFKPLQEIKEGDVVTIKTSYGVYEYQVTGTRVAHHLDDTAYDLLQDKEQLIMYTCYPFEMLVGITKQERLFVYADKISGPEVE